jgi:hypothetical protein
MSIKNQSRLTIFAALIVGVTVVSLGGLNFIVDKISKITPPQVAKQEPPLGARLGGGVNAGPGVGRDEDARMPGETTMAPRPYPTMPGGGLSGPARKINGGKNDADFEKKAPAALPPRGQMQHQGGLPGALPQHVPPGGIPPGGMPPGGMPPGGMPYFPDPSKMAPEEREAFEREMMRRQQMMQPPPDYYPPQHFQGPYDNGGYFEDDYEPYDYDPGYRGKLDNQANQVKVTQAHHELEAAEDYNYEADDIDEDYFIDDEEEE